MAKKILQCGLSYKHLQLAFNRNPQEGIRDLFTESTNGHARVTNRKKKHYFFCRQLLPREITLCETKILS
jgi:hypothetical protein